MNLLDPALIRLSLHGLYPLCYSLLLRELMIPPLRDDCDCAILVA